MKEIKKIALNLIEKLMEKSVKENEDKYKIAAEAILKIIKEL